MSKGYRELAWVDFLKKKTPRGKCVSVGIGDDCSVVRLGSKKFLFSSDLFIENVHFKLKSMSYRVIGARAASRALSDIAACAGKPLFIGVSAGIPSCVSTRGLKELMGGITGVARQFGASLIGGDTARADKLFLDIWVMGEVRRPVLRSGAKVGDYIFLTGRLGLLAFDAPFSPRIKKALHLSRTFAVNAMIDISDGFILDLFRIITASSVGALLWRDAIPTTGGLGDLYRGEDYELIFTVDRREPRLPYLKEKFWCVGQIKKRSFGYQMESGGKVKQVSVKGYTHF